MEESEIHSNLCPTFTFCSIWIGMETWKLIISYLTENLLIWATWTNTCLWFYSCYNFFWPKSENSDCMSSLKKSRIFSLFTLWGSEQLRGWRGINFSQHTVYINRLSDNSYNSNSCPFDVDRSEIWSSGGNSWVGQVQRWAEFLFTTLSLSLLSYHMSFFTASVVIKKVVKMTVYRTTLKHETSASPQIYL